MAVIPTPTISVQPRDFWVWVDPLDRLVRHQITVVGSFSWVADGGAETLMFLPNSKFVGTIGVFQNNLLKEYVAEYNLEMGRITYYPTFTSRLHAIFLFLSEADAHTYQERHCGHVRNRILKQVKTEGPYAFSVHDSSWVDFLRTPHSMRPEDIDSISRAYWSGKSVSDFELQSMGKKWTRSRISEVLFAGRIAFYDRTLPLES